MRTIRGPLTILVLGVVALVLSNSLYVVSETQRAVELRFGKLVEADLKPGLHFKLPVADEVKIFDARIQTLNSAPENFLNLEKKVMTVDSFAKWRIIDVEKFYTSTSGDVTQANRLLSRRIAESLRNEFARRTLKEVVSSDRDNIMRDLNQSLNQITRTQLGIEIIDVRVKKIELPSQVSSSVFARMRAERERQAREYRSQGQEVAEGIKADADRQKVVIEAEAYRKAEILRGEGDAAASAIYAKAYSADPEFYSFTRSLDAYQKTFKDKGDMMVIDPSSEFFDYLKNSQGIKKK